MSAVSSHGPHVLMHFDRGGVRLAIPGSAVEEVVSAPTPMPVPQLPAHLLGLVPWRARALPVLDPAPLFGLPGPEPCPFAIVVRAGGYEAVLLTERVRGLRPAPAVIEGVPAHLPGRLHTWATGILPADEDATVVLDLAAVFESAAVRP